MLKWILVLKDDGINEKFSESWEAGRGETAKEDKEQTDRGPGDQWSLIMMMMEMEKVVEQHQAVEAWVLKMKSIIGLLRELILHCW